MEIETAKGSDNLSDEFEEVGPSKRFKGVGYPSPTKESEVQHLSHAATSKGKEKKLKPSLSAEESLQNTEQEAETANERVDVPLKGSVDLPSDVGPSTMTEPKTFECADPDFSDFDKDKEESCFKVGQVWAVYDTLDAMPRFYAIIRKILSPAFKLRITWLEPDPLNEDETKWLSEGLPASCGTFRLGNLEDIEDHPIFSHLFKMTGMERDDVLEGSFELDPASLPLEKLGVSGESVDQRATANFIDSVNSAENLVASVPNQVPEPEFYRFAAERSPEKFQIGQCWAIYSDEDALPRYYGQIKKIDLLPEFVLHVAWFYACPLPKSTIQWHDKTMPIGCGLFKFPNSKLNKYTVTNNFSHVVAAEPVKKGVYKIFPRKDEVWAVHKNWSPQLNGNNLKDFEYEIVEIVNVSDNFVDVKFLVWVKGFKSVYKPRVEEQEETGGVLKICVSEHLRFSHQIPAFRLTEERRGCLRGFWELDPAGMPPYLLSTD
uniref:DNAJ heat shock N-terminal domain-containing protein n=1 Tax=Solanum tuberosum TaxID=4113 RepID=M1C3B6_SOLTU